MPAPPRLPHLLLGTVTRVLFTFKGEERAAIGYRQKPPEVFCLDQNPAETLAFLHDFRDARLLNPHPPKPSGQRRTLWIGRYTDIAAVRTITPAAALVLAAEFDRAHRRKRLGRRGIVDAADWDPGVARTLTEVGFLEHLGASLPDCQQLDPSAPGIRMLPMLTGVRNEPKEADGLRKNLEILMERTICTALGHTIYGGLIEAMDNCATHAYPKGHEFRYPIIQQRWW